MKRKLKITAQKVTETPQKIDAFSK